MCGTQKIRYRVTAVNRKLCVHFVEADEMVIFTLKLI
jgi:hypothetical protein